MKIAVITCYKQPDYVRATTLRRAIATAPGTELLVIKNRHTGSLRYVEIFLRTLMTRLRERPDVYVLTFRGYEMLPALAVLSWPKPLIYDELVNPIEWLREPRGKVWPRLVPIGLLKPFYRLLLKRCTVILADTDVHGDYSAKLSGANPQKFITVPVCADEKVFTVGQRRLGQTFRVFYYGSMLPLHGLDCVLKAAIALKAYDIEFLLVGGGEKAKTAAQMARRDGAHITYQAWIPFAGLADTARNSHLCLGGPFGDTVQARHVITGKTCQFMACGLPVVVGKTPAGELFRDGENCLEVPLGDAQALAGKILWAYHNQDKLDAIGHRGCELYQKHYSQDVANAIVAKMLTNLQPVSRVRQQDKAKKER